MEIIDTHCHLSFDPLAGDVDGVLRRAEEAGVSKIVVPAYDIGSWPIIGRLTDRRGVYAAYGLHPWKADEDLDIDQLSAILHNQRTVAVGEIGLDSKIDEGASDLERQLHVLRVQVELACNLDLPVILHCRGAFEEMFVVLRMFSPALRGVVHAFSRGPEIAQRFLDLGLHIAFGGGVTRANARRARQSAIMVPPDRLLLETDAPSIGLDGVAAEHAEPRHVLDVVLALAQLRGEEPAELAALTTVNAKALFRFDA